MTVSAWENLAIHKAKEISKEAAASSLLVIPVPINELIEEYIGDVQIVTHIDYDFPEGVSAFCRKDMEIGWLIVLNGREAPVRQRFSAAHELAHIALLSYQPSIAYCSHRSNDWMEQVCDQFAGHILMPEALVHAYYQSHPMPSLPEIAAAFKVSRPVAEIELKYLGLPFRRDSY